MGHLRYGDPGSFTDEGVGAILDANAEKRRREARGIGPQACSCGVIFDDEFTAEREFWAGMHAEHARLKGDTFDHYLEVF